MNEKHLSPKSLKIIVASVLLIKEALNEGGEFKCQLLSDLSATESEFDRVIDFFTKKDLDN